jgi:uncharacterized protein YndB with AHSA1/START domain
VQLFGCTIFVAIGDVQLISCGYARAMEQPVESVTRQLELEISPDALWEAITDRSALEAWLGDQVDVDLRPGGTGVVVDDGITRRVRVETVEHGRGWSFRWQVDDEPESHVTFAIATSDDGGSRLTITETLSAEAGAGGRGSRWELCALLLWACTAAAALVR